MSDFRMDKNQAIGKPNQTTVLGINVGRRNKPQTPYKFTETPSSQQQPQAVDDDVRFEITQPLIYDTPPTPPADVLGSCITPDEKEHDK
jgi:hypothetical protein